jgi:hypothetical protein
MKRYELKSIARQAVNFVSRCVHGTQILGEPTSAVKNGLPEHAGRYRRLLGRDFGKMFEPFVNHSAQAQVPTAKLEDGNHDRFHRLVPARRVKQARRRGKS